MPNCSPSKTNICQSVVFRPSVLLCCLYLGRLASYLAQNLVVESKHSGVASGCHIISHCVAIVQRRELLGSFKMSVKLQNTKHWSISVPMNYKQWDKKGDHAIQSCL